MPTWLKIVLAIVVAGIVMLVAAGVLIAKVVERGTRASEIARAEGEGFGLTSSLAGCVEEGVRRIGACERGALLCLIEADAFYWGCLEAAPYDAAFCAEVPAAGDDPATRKWSLATCARYGQAGDDRCAFAVSVVAPFCASR